MLYIEAWKVYVFSPYYYKTTIYSQKKEEGIKQFIFL